MTPVEEVMRGLDDLVRAGKILYIGISDAPAWVVSRANTMAELMGWTQFVGLQIRYSLIDRAVERDLIPMAREMDIAVTPWAVLGSGVLTGKFTRPESGDQSMRHKDKKTGEGILSERNMTIAREVDTIADEIGKSSSQVALSWLRQQPGNIIPILGARTESQLKDNLGCLDIELSSGHLNKLSEVSQIELGFPHDFLREEFIKDLLYGDEKNNIVNHRN
jgi:aryl-alcohol dehydrogenase-like predicted oxidoreductase